MQSKRASSPFQWATFNEIEAENGGELAATYADITCARTLWPPNQFKWQPAWTGSECAERPEGGGPILGGELAYCSIAVLCCRRRCLLDRSDQLRVALAALTWTPAPTFLHHRFL